MINNRKNRKIRVWKNKKIRWKKNLRKKVILSINKSKWIFNKCSNRQYGSQRTKNDRFISCVLGFKGVWRSLFNNIQYSQQIVSYLWTMCVIKKSSRWFGSKSVNVRSSCGNFLFFFMKINWKILFLIPSFFFFTHCVTSVALLFRKAICLKILIRNGLKWKNWFFFLPIWIWGSSLIQSMPMHGKRNRRMIYLIWFDFICQLICWKIQIKWLIWRKRKRRNTCDDDLHFISLLIHTFQIMRNGQILNFIWNRYLQQDSMLVLEICILFHHQWQKQFLALFDFHQGK